MRKDYPSTRIILHCKSKSLQRMGQVGDMFQDYNDMYLKNLNEIHTPQGLFKAARAFFFPIF